ncbi:hypothetical protein PVAP13_6KG197206 [Panicum virgatum]|uniref:Uncharacterized protein n=1 Tax=Panicum virgatum TaxID=38727 RepID=A0A8T0RCJ1_PANVG|nr:hypothetical protein PVAP13_6KG197206 [Panicum virgatum]
MLYATAIRVGGAFAINYRVSKKIRACKTRWFAIFLNSIRRFRENLDVLPRSGSRYRNI